MILLSSSSVITTHPQKCKTIKQFKQIHTQIIKLGINKTLPIFVTIESPPDLIIWNTIIRSYSINSSPFGPFSAIEFYKFMILSDIEPNTYTFPSVLKSCARIGGVSEGKQVHGHVLKLGFAFDVFIHTSLISFYSRVGEIDDARLVFDKSPMRDVVSFTALITGYLNLGRVEEACELFDEMPVRDEVSWNSVISGHAKIKHFDVAIELFNEMHKAKVKPDESTLVTVLSACAQSGNLKTGKRIETWIIDHKLCSNIRLVNALIDMYSKCNEFEKARSLFDSTIKKNVITWNVMIGGYTHTHHYKESLDLFRLMLQLNYEANEVTMLSVLPACAQMGALDTGKWIHAYIEKNFPDSCNTSLFTSLIDMYAKCGDIEAAKTVFDSMTPKSLASWNAMISGTLVKEGKWMSWVMGQTGFISKRDGSGRSANANLSIFTFLVNSYILNMIYQHYFFENSYFILFFLN